MTHVGTVESAEKPEFRYFSTPTHRSIYIGRPDPQATEQPNSVKCRFPNANRHFLQPYSSETITTAGGTLPFMTRLLIRGHIAVQAGRRGRATRVGVGGQEAARAGAIPAGAQVEQPAARRRLRFAGEAVGGGGTSRRAPGIVAVLRADRAARVGRGEHRAQPVVTYQFAVPLVSSASSAPQPRK